MGNSYELELLCLNKIYQWALNVPIEKLYSFVAASRDLPLIAIGSGGSSTAALLAALLHQRIGKISKGVTPLEFLHSGKSILDSSVLILTSRGNNADILSAFRYAVSAEPRQLMAICMKKRSPLSLLSQKFRYARFIDFDLPSREDGFLATNSLLATITLLIRAYNLISTKCDLLPEELPSVSSLRDSLDVRAKYLLDKNFIIILYGYWGLPGAVDIESKFTEAALGHVQIADYRNFGHGRHHWLAKHSTDTGVIVLETPEDTEIASKTLNLLPNNIPSMRIVTRLNGPAGSLDLLVKTMSLVDLAGKVRGINPGRPRVPKFGRDIYHLTLPRNSRFTGAAAHKMRRAEAIAILRKSKSISIADMEDIEVEYWRNAYRLFLRNLEQACFGSIVLDYDGTLCDVDERYSGPSANVISELLRLLEEGLIIGIATGRGGSVKKDLRRLIQQEHWERVLVGYYSGSDIALLNDEEHPDKTAPMHPALKVVRSLINDHHQLSLMAKFECRPKQITVEPKALSLWPKTKTILKGLVDTTNIQNVKVLESDHSLDIVAPAVSKLNIATSCQQMARSIGNPEGILCIGDKGEWPGNDYELLASPHSLSVDTVSPSASTCWNLASTGYRGTQATLEYLKCIDATRGVGHFRLR